MPASINLTQAARQALPLVDLTSLNATDTDADIESLCQQAKTPFGHPAAVCVYPQFIVTARRALTAHTLNGQVKIASVTNFPDGGADVMAAARETREAVASGADEVDVVLPYRTLIDGDEDTCLEFVEMCQAACGGQALLKIILETGELKEPALIKRASEIAIEGGADFIKTSTGKVEVSATLEAAEIMLNAIKDSGQDVGFKASGGVRTTEDAAEYLALAADIMGPAWISPKHFRFGASGLLANLAATLTGNVGTAQGDY
ncbi:deoxyribose-phosphate aldolase [Vreelandella subglaciescola]|jgi:deoxyribose-phosphate aldolase|uniref:Deoxyribose-phosphate aldolase n=1 Tax=Vreelandella subglaciescola TaxID=29571 RepID=A0A1M7I9S1_9GAMM|nr:deoxyribose-phosphate aldolase [Halomonas subglaciescola]SHM37556.1 deoxyribose-phosphate aldolase [Halomonas subglaciescola]